MRRKRHFSLALEVAYSGLRQGAFRHQNPGLAVLSTNRHLAGMFLAYMQAGVGLGVEAGHQYRQLQASQFGGQVDDRGLLAAAPLWLAMILVLSIYVCLKCFISVYDTLPDWKSVGPCPKALLAGAASAGRRDKAGECVTTCYTFQ
ncbi:hypothetical protein MYXO_01885 [Myxococcaceae bacterium]|nr:hypothetical protein MYXO_01885 [Myxococcaceae bacterium]